MEEPTAFTVRIYGMDALYLHQQFRPRACLYRHLFDADPDEELCTVRYRHSEPARLPSADMGRTLAGLVVTQVKELSTQRIQDRTNDAPIRADQPNTNFLWGRKCP